MTRMFQYDGRGLLHEPDRGSGPKPKPGGADTPLQQSGHQKYNRNIYNTGKPARRSGEQSQ